jgi:hypothetical protein
MQNIYVEISVERQRQMNRYGWQVLSPFAWCAILGKELGEAHNEALDHAFPSRQSRKGKTEIDCLKQFRQELIQIAAVAIQAVESIDSDPSLPTEEQKRIETLRVLIETYDENPLAQPVIHGMIEQFRRIQTIGAEEVTEQGT